MRRFNADGSVDTTFGAGGRVTVPGSGAADSTAQAVYVQADGKVLVAGGSGGLSADFVLSRYNADGSPDTGFAGGSGRVVANFATNFTGADVGYAIGVQSNGAIVVGGSASQMRSNLAVDTDLGLVRFNADGSRDTTFGTAGDGTVVTDVASGSSDAIASLDVLAGDKILVAGGSNGHAVVARYTASGLLDSTFNATGIVSLPQLAGAAGGGPVGLVPLANGEALVGASTADGNNFAITRLTSSGSVDPTFGTGGVATADFGGADAINSLLSLPNGQILATGVTRVGTTILTAQAMFGANGAIFTPFGTNGEVLYDQMDTNAAGQAPQGSQSGVAHTAFAAADAQGDIFFSRVDSGNAGRLRAITLDSTAPVATLTAIPTLTSGGSPDLTFTVVFTDNVAVNASTVSNNPTAITVTGPSGAIPVTLLDVTPVTPDSPVTATYSINAPSGSWGTGDNGLYTVAIAGGVVADTSAANFVAGGTLGTFAVAVPAPSAGAPTATFTAIPSIDAAGGDHVNIVVTYVDDVALQPATISTSNITVTGPGGAPLTVTGLQTQGSGQLITATYTVAAPGGSWAASANGAYTVSIAAGSVLDSGGTAVAAGPVGSFGVNISSADGTGGTLLGEFGRVGKKKVKLTFTSAEGTVVTLGLSSGAGSAYLNNGRVDLVLTGGGRSLGLSVKCKGGTGRLTVGNIRADGSFSSIDAKTSDVTGTIYTPGKLSAIAIGSLAGNIIAGGRIGSVSIAGAVSGAKILSGAALGPDGLLGGSGADADSFAVGRIDKISIGGAVTASLFAAGLDPVDGIFLNGDDRVLGGRASVIGAVTVRGGVDGATRFAGGRFGKVRLPGKVAPATDPRFFGLA